MKLIPLSQGLFATVDDEDYNWLMQWNWAASKGSEHLYYAVRHEGVKAVSMHREIIKRRDGKVDIADHHDGNGLHNCRSNLRNATHSQNSCNRRGRFDSASGYKGVSWDGARQRWIVSIQINHKPMHLGRFHDKVEAALVYNAAAVKYHREYARLNMIEEDAQLKKE